MQCDILDKILEWNKGISRKAGEIRKQYGLVKSIASVSDFFILRNELWFCKILIMGS